MYSPAARPSRQRAAPAKKRRLSAITGISSFLAASIGLPALSASRRASSSPCSSIRSAIASSACARCAGVVCDQPSNALRAALTARSISSTLEIGARAISSPVAGLSTASVSPCPLTRSPSMKLLRVSTVPAICISSSGVLFRFICAYHHGYTQLACVDSRPARGQFCQEVGTTGSRGGDRRLLDAQSLRHRSVLDVAALHVQAAAQ